MSKITDAAAERYPNDSGYGVANYAHGGSPLQLGGALTHASPGQAQRRSDFEAGARWALEVAAGIAEFGLLPGQPTNSNYEPSAPIATAIRAFAQEGEKE